MPSTAADDIKLIERCVKHQPSAQKELYELYFNYAMNIALRYCQNRDEAIEVVNDGFLRAFNSLVNFDKAQPFKPWFRRLVVNTAVDHYRKNRRHHDQDTHLYVDGGVEPDIFAQFSAENIMNCVQALPASYRIVFVLYAVEGYKHHEIADMLNISEGTSKSNLAAARSKLQNLLKDGSHTNRTYYAR